MHDNDGRIRLVCVPDASVRQPDDADTADRLAALRAESHKHGPGVRQSTRPTSCQRYLPAGSAGTRNHGAHRQLSRTLAPRVSLLPTPVCML